MPVNPRHAPQVIVDKDAPVNKAGKTAEVSKVSEAQNARPATGVYNIQTAENKQNAEKLLRESGLGVPDFVNGHSQAYVEKMPERLQNELHGMAQSVSSALDADPKRADTSDLQGKWANFTAEAVNGGFVDVNALVQFVLRESYLDTSRDLQDYAQKVRFYNDLKKSIRDELNSARQYLSAKVKGTAEKEYKNSVGSSGGVEFISSPEIDPKTGQPKPSAPQVAKDTSGNPLKLSSKEEIDNYIKGLEEKLNSVGDDAQLANVDLQNKLQQQQQTLQMMSNISKMLHDTSMSIIRKIGG